MSDDAYSLVHQLMHNIGAGEAVIFRSDHLGLHIRRTKDNGRVTLDRIVSATEVELARQPDDLLGNAIYEMALEIRGIQKP